MAHEDTRRKDTFEQPALTPFSSRVAVYAVDEAVCPNNHRLHDLELVLEDDVLRCRCREPVPGRTSKSPCGIPLYVLAGLHGRDGTRLVLVARVTKKEIETMQEMRMNLPDILRYLGLGWPLRDRDPRG